MSTRCWIGQKREDGIHAFYCHHDGYIEYGVGEQLFVYYNTEDKVTKLVDLCYNTGTSSLVNTLEGTKKFLYNRTPDDGFSLNIFEDELEYADCDFDIEYVYLFKDGEWWVSEAYHKPWMIYYGTIRPAPFNKLIDIISPTNIGISN